MTCPAVALAKADAKRAAAFATVLKDELLENVGHCLWTFTIPKMLRPYFMYQRELLGDLVRLANETIHELMEVPDASHYVHDDNLEACVAELEAFLSDPP